MKRGLAICAVALLALTGTAKAELFKALARNAAEIAAINFSSHKTWATSSKIGACKQVSRRRVDCDGTVIGDELVGCADDISTCEYTFHSCKFTAAVHEAGFSRVARIQQVHCRTRRHSG